MSCLYFDCDARWVPDAYITRRKSALRSNSNLFYLLYTDAMASAAVATYLADISQLLKLPTSQKFLVTEMLAILLFGIVARVLKREEIYLFVDTGRNTHRPDYIICIYHRVSHI